MNQEQRERMTEMFVAVRDALLRAVVPTYEVEMKRAPDYPRPFYLPEIPPQTVGQYRAALAKLGKLGLVREN